MTVSEGERQVSRVVHIDHDAVGRREADHRIANSLQLLSALLSSQGRDITDPSARAALETSVQRIGAIAGVHRQLYRSEGEEVVDLREYLTDLLTGLKDSFSCRNRRIHLEVEPIITSGDFAGVVGIIVTELVINACKHAYDADQQGDIEVAFATETSRTFSLEVRDHGRGLAREKCGDIGLGSRIVELMARKIGAQASYFPVEEGTSFVINGSIPLS